MTRKQDYRITAWTRIFVIVFNIIMSVALLVAGKYWTAFWSIIIAIWTFDSYIQIRKWFKIKEAAITMFNILNPDKGVKDDDFVEFMISNKKDEMRGVTVSIYRHTPKKNEETK